MDLATFGLWVAGVIVAINITILLHTIYTFLKAEKQMCDYRIGRSTPNIAKPFVAGVIGVALFSVLTYGVATYQPNYILAYLCIDPIVTALDLIIEWKSNTKQDTHLLILAIVVILMFFYLVYEYVKNNAAE